MQEHEPVYTLGRRGVRDALLHEDDFYAKIGADIVKTGRGIGGLFFDGRW